MIAIADILAQAAHQDVRLNAGGITIMTINILLVCGLLGFCLYRILRKPDGE